MTAPAQAEEDPARAVLPLEGDPNDSNQSAKPVLAGSQCENAEQRAAELSVGEPNYCANASQEPQQVISVLGEIAASHSVLLGRSVMKR